MLLMCTSDPFTLTYKQGLVEFKCMELALDSSLPACPGRSVCAVVRDLPAGGSALESKHSVGARAN